MVRKYDGYTDKSPTYLSRESSAARSPERELWCAVVLNAISEVDKGKSNDYWFFVSPQSSFRWICDNLGFDADSIEQAVQLRKGKHRAKRDKGTLVQEDVWSEPDELW